MTMMANICPADPQNQRYAASPGYIKDVTPIQTMIKFRKMGGCSEFLDNTNRASTNLSNDCEARTAQSQIIGQIDGASESVATEINMAMNMRECQFAMRIEYIAR